MGFTEGLLQVNPYDASSFRGSEIAAGLIGRLPAHVVPVWSRSGIFDADHQGAHRTPRWRHMTGFFSMVSLYYLDFIMREDPGIVADIGCGENMFKEFYPQIVGFDPFVPAADHQAYFDEEFVMDNKGAFDSAFACNSIHFATVEQFRDRLGMMASMVRPGGIVHATANATRFMDAESDGPENQYQWDECVDMAMRIDAMVRSADLDWLVVDQCYEFGEDGQVEFNNGIVGNLRLVFRV